MAGILYSIEWKKGGKQASLKIVESKVYELYMFDNKCNSCVL